MTSNKNSEKDIYKPYIPDPALRKLLNDFVNNSKKDALLIVHDGELLDANEAALKLLGYDRREEVFGYSPEDMMTYESAMKVRVQLEQRLCGRWPCGISTYELRRKNGKTINVDLNVIPWPSDPALAVVHLSESIPLETNVNVLNGAVNLKKTLVEEIPGGFILTDNNGGVVFMNRRASEITGYASDELSDIELLIPESETGTYNAYRQTLKMGTSGRIPEAKLVRKGGAEFWASVSWNAILDKEGNIQAVCTVLNDITEQKTTADALYLAEERYRLLAENALDILWETDLDGVFTYISNAVTHILGYTPEECIGKKLVQFLDQSERKKRKVIPKDFLKVTDGYPGRLSEVKMISKDNTSVWVEIAWSVARIKGTPVGFHGIARNITKRKKAEEALKNSEEQFRTLIGNLPDVVYRCDCDSNWTMTLISEAIEDLTGYPASDFIKENIRTYASIIHPDDRELVSSTINTAVAKREPYTITYRTVHRDGSIRWVYEKGQGIFSEDDKLLWLDGVVSDVTKQKRIQEAWKKAHEDMQRAYELQRQFLNNVTHEVRTPLTAIQGYSLMILEGLAGPVSEQQSSLLRKMLVCSGDLLTMVGGVLDIARIKSGIVGVCPKVCSPRMIVDKCILTVKPQANAKGLRINIESSNDAQQGLYDEDKLSAIITNLLSNAVKFTDTGGIEIFLTSDANGMEVIVADTGMGINESDFDTIFDEFSQLEYPKKHKPAGFGIGLAIVAAMVETIGATLTVSSKKGHGTAFMLQVPVLDPNA